MAFLTCLPSPLSPADHPTAAGGCVVAPTELFVVPSRQLTGVARMSVPVAKDVNVEIGWFSKTTTFVRLEVLFRRYMTMVSATSIAFGKS